MTTRTIVVEERDRVALITLNRPAALNAYTVDMGIELFTALGELDRRDDIRAIVVTGAGRAFCAGADLSSGGSTFAGDHTWQRAAELEAAVSPWRRNTPVIAAINGAAVGIGATLPLQWDIRLAADVARIGFVFTRRGISPEAGSTWILPRLIGAARASEVLLLGRLMSAAEACELGIVSRVVESDQLVAAALDMANDIADNTAPVSAAVTRRLLWSNLAEPDPERAKRREDAIFSWIGKQPDAAEGVTSFLEKRPPQWSMSLEHVPGELLTE